MAFMIRTCIKSDVIMCTFLIISVALTKTESQLMIYFKYFSLFCLGWKIKKIVIGKMRRKETDLCVDVRENR